MSQQWYLSREGRRYGPYSWEQMREFAGSGKVMQQDLIWTNQLTDWVKAAEVEGLFKPAQPDQAAPPAPPNQPQETPVTQGQAPRQPAGVQSGEKILGIIPAMRRKTGLFSSKTYSLLVTDRRILFAELTAQMLNQAAKDAAAEAKAQGKGFFARAADTMKSNQRIYQKYWQMNLQDILAETPGNYSIEHRDITSIKIRHGMFNEEQGQHDKDEMHIKTTREKMKLIFEHDNTSRNAKKLLRELLGKVVR